MKAMILAAGQGTRLRPLTERIPKCMIPLGGKPLLAHTLEQFARHGITDIIINLCYLPQVITDYFGDGSRWGVRLTYALEQEALGTAGGVKNVAWFFAEDPFVVWYGDNLSRCNLGRLVSFHRAHGGLATVALLHREDVTQSGIVGLAAEDRIERFLEKPRAAEAFSHWVNAGIYVLEPAVLNHISPAGAQDFGRNVFPTLLAAGQRLYGYRLAPDEGLWWVDTFDDLSRAQAEWRTREEMS